MIGMRNLRAFVAVAEEKNFTRAAEKLSLTQPALSKQIKVLEEFLGAQLINRQEREITLSEAGSYFVVEAQKILEIMDSAQEVIKEINGLGRGRLLVGASSLPGEYILPQLLGGFHKLYPGIEIDLRISDTAAVIADVKQGKLQIGFVGAEPREPNLTSHAAFPDEIILLAPQGWSNDWQKETLIIRELGSGTRKVIENYLSKIGGSLREQKVMELGSTRAIINAVKAGLGVGFVPRRTAEETLQLGSVQEVPLMGGPIQRPIYVIRSQSRTLNLTGRAFLNYLNSQ